MALVGDVEVILHIRFATPPGTSPEKAAQMLAQGGVNVPLGLVQFVRNVHVEVLTGETPQGPKLTV